MSARPGEWHLLGHGSDPVPGDPEAVADEADHYRDVAVTIRDQVARLRRLARPDAALKGHYADALQESCEELADHLEKAQDRFETTGAQLAVLAPALRTARQATRRALDAAVEAQATVEANQPDTTPRPGAAPPPTPAEVQADQARAQRHQAGLNRLGEARAACARAVADFDEVADQVAGRIRDAADDDLEDSRWDGFKEAVHSISGVLGAVADVLGWIATVLTVIAIFIPGLNLLVIGVLLLAGALLVHGLLAATGNGSWLNVALDVFGILTLGVGTKALAVARLGRSATLAVVGRQAATRASAQVFTRAAWNGGRGVLGRVSLFVVRRLPSVRAAAARAADDAMARALAHPLPRPSAAGIVRAGFDVEAAAMADDLALLARTHGRQVLDPRFVTGVAVARNSAAAGASVDLTGKALDGLAVGDAKAYEVGPWERAKARTTVEVGGPW